MKNTLSNFAMTPEAQRALSDFFELLKAQAQKSTVSKDACDDLFASLDEHISCALRESCDRKRVTTVDAQTMLEVLLALGSADELIEALEGTPALSGSGTAENAEKADVSRTGLRDYAFPRWRVLKRSSKDRWLMGVCGGFAEYWGVSSLLLRFLMLFSGIGLFAYIIIGLIMPPSDYQENQGQSHSSGFFRRLQTVIMIILAIFMITVLYIPLSGALLGVAAAGFFKILSELGMVGWQSGDLWFYFTTGLPGYISGMAGLIAGLGFFALLTQFFASTFFGRSILNINTRKLVMIMGVTSLLTLAGMAMICGTMQKNVTSSNLSHVFAADEVKEIFIDFPGRQMPFHRKLIQVIGDAGISEIKIDVTRRVGGFNEHLAANNLNSLDYICELEQNGRLRLGGNITRPVWNFYPFPEVTFVIRVPENQNLKISCRQQDAKSGDVEISRITGPINAELQGGKIRLESLSSPEINLRSQVGNIEILQVKSDLINATSNVGQISCSGVSATRAVVKTDVGSIRINEFSGEELEAASEVGSIRVADWSAARTTLTTRTGSINAKTVSLRADSEMKIKSEIGSVKLELPADSNPVLTLKSDIGHITNAFKDSISGPGAAKINIQSNIGSIRIKKSAAKSVLPEKKPVLPAESTETD
jgi:phage shock protein PspC (stress-responsive transcriptional regulator)